jgi:hypothetical protein
MNVYRQYRLAVAMVWIIIGASLVGWDQGSKLGSAPAAALTLTRAGSTTTIPVTHTRTVKRIVKGKVRTLEGGTRVVDVPRVVVLVRSCHRTRQHQCARHVVVPAHRIRLRAGTVHQLVATAAPLVPVTVTVFVPTTVYQTVTSPPETFTATETTTETTIVPTTITVTVPLSPGDST